MILVVSLTDVRMLCLYSLFRLLYADIVFTCIFIIEMIMKIIVYGFINSKAAYLKDPWNVMDFTIVLVGSISLVM